MSQEITIRNGLYGFEMRDEDRRRRSPEERKTYEIKQLWQLNHEILNLAAKGFKQVEIADILNITPQTVSNTLNSELGQHKLSELRLERDEETKVIAEKIRVLTNKALKIYHEIIDDESGESTLKDKKTVADTVMLELSGLRAPTKIQSATMNYNLSKEDIEEFKRRAVQAARESGMIVDVEEEKVTKEEFHDSLD